MGLFSKIRNRLKRMDCQGSLFAECDEDFPVATPTPIHTYQPYSGRFFTLDIKMSSYLSTPDIKEIIYVEREFDTATNEFIEANYDKICKTFRRFDYEFCYIPRIVAHINDTSGADYHAPYRDTQYPIDYSSSRFIRDAIHNEERIGPSLMYYDKAFKNRSTTDVYTFRCITLDITKADTAFYEVLQAIMDDIASTRKSHICAYSPPRPDNFGTFEYFDADCADIECYSESRPRYSIPSYDDSSLCYSLDYVNAEFEDKETAQLIKEIESRVERLKQKGISEHIIQSIVSKPTTTSRMVITRDNRIILPDYNNMEITMTPLVKAVYFLFLRHTNGINFKDLVDYRKELTSIYESIKGEPADSRMSKSICDLTDPTKNSINEKVARIREAFVTRFKESLSTNYIVNGERGEAKRVLLNRELVTWE